ncbi:MAG TPA: glycosyl hydrolase [Pseudomonadales bacterium]|nr:glycosyl hydrolase [Pseudomonadales bacterium]
MTKTCLKSFAPAVFTATLLATLSLSAADDIGRLQQSFDQPPDDARIMVRWWWFGPAATKPEIEREMTVMKEGGIGGFEATTCYPLALNGTLPGLTNYGLLSPEHLDALGFAAAKAKELGLRMDLTLGSGWPYGGPQITRSNAADAIHESEPVNVSPGQKSVEMAPVHSRKGEGENQIIAALLGPMKNASAEASYLPLEVHGNTALLPDDLHGATQVTFYTLAHPNLVNVKRAAVGGEGYIVDHYSPTAVDTFIKDIAEPEVKACGPNPPYSIFCDSLEVSGEDWTPDFLAEFKKRRGYDLTPLLPALFNDFGPRTPDIRQDWARTVTEVFDDYFMKGFTKFAHENNSRFRIQAYGTPPAALFSYADCDLPEGELGGGNNEKDWSATRWASSASHLLGQPVTSSETFTWLHSPVFRATPLDMKAEADLHFLCGINQIICHGWPYTAPGAPYPGWSFYAAGVFDEKNPWWIVMPDVTKYLQRVSYILRQGEPANDVALYMPDSDAWASLGPDFSLTAALKSRVSDPTRAILNAGYDLDYFDDQLLATRGKVSGDTLKFGGVRYRAVVLPGVERIPLATMKTLEKFAHDGGIVIASQRLPDLAPGYKTPASDTKDVQDIVQRLFKDPNAPGIFVKDDNQIGVALAKRLQPDVVFSSAADQIGEVHRHTDDGEVYFIANTDNQPHNVSAAFRVTGLQAEIWNPMDGSVRPAPVMGKSSDATTVQLVLPPYGSTIVVFTKRSQVVPIFLPLASIPPPVDLNTGWTVQFGTNDAPVAMDTLASWTTLKDEVNFSGVATYEKTVTVAPEMLQTGLSLALDFGQGKPTQDEGHGVRADLDAPVREAAIVYVNGQRASSLWCPPYSIDVTGKLHAGENQIRVEVANLAINYMASIRFPNYDYRGLTREYGNRFQPQNLDEIQPLPSGLLGPVRLVASARPH